MSVDQARALVRRLNDDPEFAERLQALPVEERRQVLESEGFGVVLKEHIDAAIYPGGGELSDDEFAAVAGGTSSGTDNAIAGSVLASAISVVGAAAFAA